MTSARGKAKRPAPEVVLEPAAVETPGAREAFLDLLLDLVDARRQPEPSPDVPNATRAEVQCSKQNAPVEPITHQRHRPPATAVVERIEQPVDPVRRRRIGDALLRITKSKGGAS